MYTRNHILTNLIISLDTQYTPMHGQPQVTASIGSIITDANGSQVFPPSFTQQPAVGADLTPEVLEALNNALAYTGFKLVKAD